MIPKNQMVKNLFKRNGKKLFKNLKKPRSGFEPGLNRSAGDCVTAPPPWQPV